MTQEQLQAIFRGAAAYAHAYEASGLGPFRAAIDHLLAQLVPALPAKDDGSSWTADDVHAAAEAARVPFQEVLDR